MPKDKLKSVSDCQDNVRLSYFEFNFLLSWNH